MCYESLVDEEEATGKPVSTLVREEMGSAVVDAATATTAVVAMLLVAGTQLWLVAATALVTPVVTVFFHQVVLVVGIGVVRWRTGSVTATPDTT